MGKKTWGTHHQSYDVMCMGEYKEYNNNTSKREYKILRTYEELQYSEGIRGNPQ